MTPERRLWNDTREGLTAAANTTGIVLQLHRVENAAERSFPDVFGRWDTFDFWIELKASRLQFQAGQCRWLADQWEARGNSFLLHRPTNTTILKLYRGDQVLALEAGTLAEPPELIIPLKGKWKTLLDRITWGGNEPADK